MAYLAKFDDSGACRAIYLAGTKTAEDAAGCVEISDEEWAYYIGNRGQGDNGTGYIRGAETGKPVSAPPAPAADPEPQEMDVQPIPETELAVMEGMVNIQTRLAAIEAKLKGGE